MRGYREPNIKVTACHYHACTGHPATKIYHKGNSYYGFNLESTRVEKVSPHSANLRRTPVQQLRIHSDNNPRRWKNKENRECRCWRYQSNNHKLNQWTLET